jgi:hypothetical protein
MVDTSYETTPISGRELIQEEVKNVLVTLAAN